MIIDFHTHIFPEKIASRAIASLEQKAKMRAHVSGVEASLRASMDKSGVDLSIILPVVTNPHQFETVNRVAVETNEHTKETGLLSFGGIHPDNDNYREIIQFLADHGCKGIKIHPVYQGVAIDDIRFYASLTVRKNTVWSPLHMPDTTLVFREKNNPFLYTYAIC